MHRSVRSALLIPLTATAFLTGCMSTPDQADEVAPPFVFRSLNLNQRRDDGSRDWDLISPEVRYDLESRTVQAQSPSGLIYRDDKPYLRILRDRPPLSTTVIGLSSRATSNFNRSQTNAF